MKDNPTAEVPASNPGDEKLKFGATECFVESKLLSNTEQGLLLMAVGLLGMAVGVMGLLGGFPFINRRDR